MKEVYSGKKYKIYTLSESTAKGTKNYRSILPEFYFRTGVNGFSIFIGFSFLGFASKILFMKKLNQSQAANIIKTISWD